MDRLRPFVGVMFRCCRVYRRIYLNHADTAFVGACPRGGPGIEIPRAAANPAVKRTSK